ncbi:succinate dehydrogenase iron-sulfur subunit [Criblamydia sequanensis]|uniref:succinate dehydrogenase n=1 Tax=Candidatus Criblamydia sequanensis CRIB-18 TaxID=1437425 RepID=A0A090D2J7_9BACT|nr:succinate dehydrogenase iron-sulfur subunit [Criblamydia sequanensis]CDR34423.1 Succinate dehydrogenase iron-sulfur subunit [Criblamydia sequanensis CRIB-18]
MEDKKYILKIYRGVPGNQYFEEFELTLEDPSTNIISALMQIQMNPYNIKGEKSTPIAWEQGCLEEVCGSCSMLINGKPRQACSAIIKNILKTSDSNVIYLAPFTKFPLVKDLIVDRSVMFENLKKVRGWIETDGAFERGPGPKISQTKQEALYHFSTCMTCGCCVEACPQSNNRNKFIGPQIIAQVKLFNLHPIGKNDKDYRLHVMQEEGGIADCGNAQNCVRVCPKKIQLTDAIAEMGREVNLKWFRDLFSFRERAD